MRFLGTPVVVAVATQADGPERDITESGSVLRDGALIPESNTVASVSPAWIAFATIALKVFRMKHSISAT